MKNQHILTRPNPTLLNEVMEAWEEKGYLAQGGLVYGLVGDVNAYSILVVKKPQRATKATGKRFVPPTLQEVKDYISEQKYGVNPEAWFAYYEKVGWMVNKKKMVNWQAGVRTWQFSNKTNRDALNIPKPKEFQKKFDETKKVDPKKVREMLEKNERINANIAGFKATGMMGEQK